MLKSSKAIIRKLRFWQVPVAIHYGVLAFSRTSLVMLTSSFLAHVFHSLSAGINNIKGLKVDLDSVETNIVSILLFSDYAYMI